METKSVKQIEKDLNRTFPGDKSFNKQELKDILITYSYRNPNVGYCQGLNFIVALLLSLNFSEEEAFWIYVQIIEKYLPLEYFTSMSGVILDQKIFDYLFRIKLQKLCKFMEKHGVESCLFTVQWFICMFSFNFQKHIVAQLWDHIFLYGHTAMFQIGLCTLWALRKEIFGKKEFVQILDSIENGCRKISDFSVFLTAFASRNFRIKTTLINKLKSVLEVDVMNEYKERLSGVIDKRILLGSLDIVCNDENECRQKVLCTSGYFTFISGEIKVNNRFIDENEYPKILNAKYLRDNEEVYTMGKKNHCCSLENDLNSLSDDDDEEEITFIKRNTTASVKKSFAYISNQVNLSDFE